MEIAARIESLGLKLPEPPRAAGSYVTSRRAGQLLFLSGVVSTHRDGTVLTGTLGADRTTDEGYSAARACALMHLAVLKAELNTLQIVDSIVSVTGFVQAARGFVDMPAVLNGYSDLMLDVFGEPGTHTRAAVGVASLPRNAMVEVQAVIALKA